MSLLQLCIATYALARYAFSPSTDKNHLTEALTFIDFCEYYLQFLLPTLPTVCYYITYLTTRFASAPVYATTFWACACYVPSCHSTLWPWTHSQLVKALLWAADITICTPSVRRLPILPKTLTEMCSWHQVWVH